MNASVGSCNSLVFDQTNEPIKTNIYLLLSTFDEDDSTSAVNYTKIQLKQPTCVLNSEISENIIYLLLKIIDKNLCKQHIKYWPLLDKKMKSEFRTEVKNIVKVLNAKYPAARLPILQTSHLVSPGRKMLSFFLYLSELAMVEYLKRTCIDDEDEEETDCMLLPLHLTKDKHRNKIQHEGFDRVIMNELKQYQHDRTERDKIIETSIAESNKIVSRIENYQHDIANLQQAKIEEVELGVDTLSKKKNDVQDLANCLDKIKFYINLLNAPEKITLTFTPELLRNPKMLVENGVVVDQKLCFKPFLELVFNILKKNVMYIERMQPKAGTGPLEIILNQHSVQYQRQLEQLYLWIPWLKQLLSEANTKVAEYHKALLLKYEGADTKIIDEHLSEFVQLNFFDLITPVKNRCASNSTNSIFGRFSTISKKNRSTVPRSNTVPKKKL